MMPAMNGLYLSTKLLEINPKLYVIIMSEFLELDVIINLIFLKNEYQYTN